MSALRQAAQQALEAMSSFENGTGGLYEGEFSAEIAALRAALAEPVQQGCDHCNQPLYAATRCRVCGRVTEPVQEPVGEVVAIDFSEESGPEAIVTLHQDVELGTMLYTAPPQRKPLTDEEISNIWDGHIVPIFGKNGINPIVFARAIERAHGIT